MRTVRWWIETGFVGGTHEGTWEIPEEDFEDKDEREINEMLDGYAETEIANHIEMGWEIVDA